MVYRSYDGSTIRVLAPPDTFKSDVAVKSKRMARAGKEPESEMLAQGRERAGLNTVKLEKWSLMWLYLVNVLGQSLSRISGRSVYSGFTW